MGWGKRFAVGAVALAAAVIAGAAEAQTCVPATFPPPVDPAEAAWEVEGKISAYDLVARTFTVNGMTFTVPVDLLIATADLDGPGNLEFAALVDPALEAVRTIVGGTGIALGETDFVATPDGTCLTFRATSVYVELAENVLAGPLNAAEGSFLVVNGATVVQNGDPRWPARVVDVGGNEIPFSGLAGLEGVLISAEGYFDPATNALQATLIEVDTVLPGEGTDTVSITRTELRGNRLRVRGQVSLQPTTGTFVPSVDVYSGILDPAGGCAGTSLGSAAVDPVDGTFDFRSRNLTGAAPTTVCVSSPGGGAAQATL